MFAHLSLKYGIRRRSVHQSLSCDLAFCGNSAHEQPLYEVVAPKRAINAAATSETGHEAALHCLTGKLVGKLRYCLVHHYHHDLQDRSSMGGNASLPEVCMHDEQAGHGPSGPRGLPAGAADSW
ncbi:MAG: hypothetical protein ACRDS0_26560 [Pseudonocardiaceae bacterium]